MFKLFHKFYSSIIFTKPSVHYIQPKSLNVYFKNSMTPTYYLFNLNKYDYIYLETAQEKENENNVFKLNLIATIGIDSETINLAKFETRKEAEEALDMLKNKIFSPEKSIFKLLAIVAIIFFCLMFIAALVQANRQVINSPQQQQYSGVNQQLLQQLQQQQQLPKLASPEDQVKAYQALQEARQQANQVMDNGATQNQQPSTTAPVEIPQDPSVKEFVNGLNK